MIRKENSNSIAVWLPITNSGKALSSLHVYRSGRICLESNPFFLLVRTPVDNEAKGGELHQHFVTQNICKFYNLSPPVIKPLHSHKISKEK